MCARTDLFAALPGDGVGPGLPAVWHPLDGTRFTSTMALAFNALTAHRAGIMALPGSIRCNAGPVPVPGPVLADWQAGAASWPTAWTLHIDTTPERGRWWQHTALQPRAANLLLALDRAERAGLPRPHAAIATGSREALVQDIALLRALGVLIAEGRDASGVERIIVGSELALQAPTTGDPVVTGRHVCPFHEAIELVGWYPNVRGADRIAG